MQMVRSEARWVYGALTGASTAPINSHCALRQVRASDGEAKGDSNCTMTLGRLVMMNFRHDLVHSASLLGLPQPDIKRYKVQLRVGSKTVDRWSL